MHRKRVEHFVDDDGTAPAFREPVDPFDPGPMIGQRGRQVLHHPHGECLTRRCLREVIDLDPLCLSRFARVAVDTHEGISGPYIRKVGALGKSDESIFSSG